MTDDDAQALTKTLLGTTDAAVWAREFIALFPQMDEGTMLGWFANAIEVGRTAGQGALAERDATIARIRGLHYGDRDGWCNHDGWSWPCGTIRVLDGGAP